MQEKRENNVRLISPCLKAGVLRRDPIKNPAPISEGGKFDLIYLKNMI